MSEESPSMEDKQHEYDINQLRFAGFWVRFVAAIIDGLIFLPLVALEAYNKINIHSISLLILISAATALYKPWLEYTQGATIGKSIMDLKVIDSQELGALSLHQSIMRSVPWILSYVITMMISYTYYKSGDYATSFISLNEHLQNSFWANLNGLYSIVFLAIIGIVAFDRKNQGLHDKLAETYCVYDTIED